MKQGYVYFVSCKDHEYRLSNPYLKIGQTIDLDGRLSQLQTSSPVDLCYVAYLKVQDRKSLEGYFHEVFGRDRIRGEWFKVSESMVRLMRTYQLDYDDLDGFFLKPVWSKRELCLMDEIVQLKRIIQSNNARIELLSSETPVRKEYSNRRRKRDIEKFKYDCKYKSEVELVAASGNFTGIHVDD